MKKLTFISLFLLAGSIILTSFFPFAPESNGWRGKNRDGKVEGFKTPSTWPGQLKQTWRTSVGLGDASPVLVNGKLFVHTKIDSSEVALCLNAADGKIIWREINNKAPEVTGGAASHPGPRSTPSIASGKVVNIGAGGYVTCRNAETGKLVWETDKYTGEVPQFFVAVSPLIIGNKVIAHLNGKEKGAIVALDLITGKEIWRLDGKSSTYSSPVLMEKFPGLIVIQGETSLLGVSLDTGELYWETPTPGETRFYNSSTPVIMGDQIIITGQGSGARALKIGLEGGRWNVSETWKNKEYSTSFNTMVLKDGYLYGNEARFGYVFCLNANTGATCWGDTAKNNRFASTLDLGKVMASLPATGNLIFFEPTEKAFRQIIRYKVADTEVYAHPVFEADKIFVKDKEYLTAWSL